MRGSSASIPNITVGVWVGYDEKKPLGSGETGAAAALPIWMDFMKVYIEKHGDRKSPPQFEAPGNIVFVTLDSGITEAFINGTQPTATASARLRRRRTAGTSATCVIRQRSRSRASHRRRQASCRCAGGASATDATPSYAASVITSKHADGNQYLNRIKERGHDEGNEEQPIHQQQRHTTVVADHFVPVPTQKSEHSDLLHATGPFGDVSPRPSRLAIWTRRQRRRRE